MILNVIRKHGVSLFAIVAIAMFMPAQSPAQLVMTHHTREAVETGSARLMGRMPAATTLNLDLVLPLRDPAGLKSFLADVYDPKSANYRHFLTPTEFTAKFGPTQEQYDAVVSFAKENGFAVTGGSRDGMEVQVKGTVATIESAMHVTMHSYQHPSEGRTFYAPDREPTVNLPFSLWHVSGLDNYSQPHPLYVKKSDYAKAHGVSPESISTHATTGSGPSASFLGSDMRAAYYGMGSLTGAGQNLGLFEYLGTDLADLTTYFKNVGQTNNVPITLVSTDGTSTSCVYSRAGGNCDDGEQTLDMTQAIGMAPGLASLVVYVGSVDTAIISAMTTHNPLPTTIGCSWGWTPADPSTLDPYFQKMAAQGQNFFAASGDSSTWSSSNEAWPADDAYVVSVGGTDLTTSSANGPWKSETAWVDSGGGITPDSIAIPSWQAASGVINSSNKGSTTLRNGPDVAANANFSFYTCSDQEACLANEYGGTSFAAPMWAAYIALVNQQLVANGKSTLGFLNPTIYAQNESGGTTTSAYAADFHDITSGTSGSYSATKGYDLVTGWGSPNSGLLAALAPTGSSCTPTAIVPYIYSSATGSWAQESSISVASGTTVDLGPQPVSGGSWSWTGPNGFTSTAREIDSIPLSTGANSYVATYTNASGCKSTQTFSVTVASGGTAIVPYIYTSTAGAWAQETSVTVSSTSVTVDLGPQPVSGGSWSWTGPNGYTSTSRQINSIPLTVGTDTYTATYTNSSGAKTTQAFTITVQ